jgi:hypothetical protein
MSFHTRFCTIKMYLIRFKKSKNLKSLTINNKINSKTSESIYRILTFQNTAKTLKNSTKLWMGSSSTSRSPSTQNPQQTRKQSRNSTSTQISTISQNIAPQSPDLPTIKANRKTVAPVSMMKIDHSLKIYLQIKHLFRPNPKSFFLMMRKMRRSLIYLVVNLMSLRSTWALNMEIKYFKRGSR